jgi:hypothetical protein
MEWQRIFSFLIMFYCFINQKEQIYRSLILYHFLVSFIMCVCSGVGVGKSYFKDCLQQAKTVLSHLKVPPPPSFSG